MKTSVKPSVPAPSGELITVSTRNPFKSVELSTAPVEFKVSELTGIPLRCAVAKAMGGELFIRRDGVPCTPENLLFYDSLVPIPAFETEIGISMGLLWDNGITVSAISESQVMQATSGCGVVERSDDPLLAGLRCLVRVKCGLFIELPQWVTEIQ